MAQREIEDLVSRLRPVFEKHRVVRAILFGSIARGDASRHRDLDIIVVQDTDKRFFDRYDPLQRELVQAVPGRGVDLLIYTPDELDRISDRRLIATALREGKVIHKSEQARCSTSSTSPRDIQTASPISPPARHTAGRTPREGSKRPAR